MFFHKHEIVFIAKCLEKQLVVVLEENDVFLLNPVTPSVGHMCMTMQVKAIQHYFHLAPFDFQTVAK